MSARRPGASWISQSYDKLALVVVLFLLLVSAGYLLFRTNQAKQAIAGETPHLAAMTGKVAEPVDLAGLTNLMAAVKSPVQVSVQNPHMMVGEQRVASIPDGAPIPIDALKDPFTGADQPVADYDPDSDGDGLTDKIEIANGLNPHDPTDADADFDGDGFTNAEEIRAGTDLRDPKSFPPPVVKVRLARTMVKPFKFRFLGVSRLPNGDRYQLNLRSLEKTYFAQLNEFIEGYKVLSYEEKAPDGPTLLLTQGDSTIRLVRGRVLNQDARSAELVSLLDGTSFVCQIGDEVKVKGLAYKVVDIKADRVVLRDARDSKDSVVSPLSSVERMNLNVRAAPAAPAAPAAADSTDTSSLQEQPF